MPCRVFTTLFFLTFTLVVSAAALPPSPDQIFGQLFEDVQRGRVFDDQKTFVDCVPREKPTEILRKYAEEKSRPGFQLSAFVAAHFIEPVTPTGKSALPHPESGTHLTTEEHIRALWPILQRSADREVPGSSLLPLPYPYIVPGGRFREIYYWDSYFTMLGLRASQREDLIASMVENFAYLEKNYGHIPNGNRTYFLSRSQPPFFSLMVDLLAERRGPKTYADYLSALETEYAYWNDRGAMLIAPTHHRVSLQNGVELTRYYDQLATPRPEAFAKEEATMRASKEPSENIYRNLRATAESGWDFSSRWFGEDNSLASTETLEVLPVDLNCLIQHLEATLAKGYRESGDKAKAVHFDDLAAKRREAIERVFWSERDGYFFDFDVRTQQLRNAWTLAGVAPLFFHLATPEQASRVAKVIQEKFLRPGGVVTTLVKTGQQWDAPNGWAPLQWMTIHGLENYGEHALASEIAHRWLALNDAVYRNTGKMMEKYNVEDLSLTAGGG
ncbi:MAG TPA: alpha,alpha-trehalase TreF, partial [Opitutaceae bacterium]